MDLKIIANYGENFADGYIQDLCSSIMTKQNLSDKELAKYLRDVERKINAEAKRLIDEENANPLTPRLATESTMGVLDFCILIHELRLHVLDKKNPMPFDYSTDGESMPQPYVYKYVPELPVLNDEVSDKYNDYSQEKYDKTIEKCRNIVDKIVEFEAKENEADKAVIIEEARLKYEADKAAREKAAQAEAAVNDDENKKPKKKANEEPPFDPSSVAFEPMHSFATFTDAYNTDIATLKFAKLLENGGKVENGTIFEMAMREAKPKIKEYEEYKNKNSFGLDRFIFALNQYMSAKGENATITEADIQNDFLNIYPGVLGDDVKDVKGVCAYIKNLVSADNLDVDTMRQNNYQQISYRTISYLNKPEVKKSLSGLNGGGSDIDYLNQFFGALKSNGLSSYISDMSSGNNVEVSAMSMYAIKQDLIENQKSGHMLAGERFVTSFEAYVKTKVGGQQINETLQKNIDDYKKSLDKYKKAYKDNKLNDDIIREIGSSTDSMVQSIKTYLGDSDLGEMIYNKNVAYGNIFSDKTVLNIQSFIYSQYPKLAPKYATIEFISQFGPYYDELAKIPSMMERGLCFVGLYMNLNHVDTIDLETLDILNCIMEFRDCEKEEKDLFSGTVMKLAEVFSEGFQTMKYHSEGTCINSRHLFSKTAIEKIKYKDIGLNQDFDCGLNNVHIILENMKKNGIMDSLLEANLPQYKNRNIKEVDDDLELINKCKDFFLKNYEFTDLLIGPYMRPNDYKTNVEYQQSVAFNRIFMDSEHCKFKDFYAELGEFKDTKPDTFAKSSARGHEIANQLRRVMPLIYNFGLDGNSDVQQGLYDIMNQIKKPRVNYRSDEKMTGAQFISIVDEFSENELSQKMDKIIEEFNAKLLRDGEKIDKYCQNVYKSSSQKEKYTNLTDVVFNKKDVDNKPFELQTSWDMESYNKRTDNKVSPNECIMQSLLHYKQLASYLPLLSKVYATDQVNLEKSKLPGGSNDSKTRHGYYVMSNIVDLQSHDRDNEPGMELYYAREIIKVIDEEFEWAKKNGKLDEFFASLANNACFDDRVRDFQAYAAKRKADDSELVVPPADGSIYFKKIFKKNEIQQEAMSKSTLLSGINCIVSGLQREYDGLIPSTDMVRGIVSSMLLGVEYQKNVTTQKDIDTCLNQMVNEYMTLYNESPEERIEDIKTMMTKWRGTHKGEDWTEENKKAAREYVTELLGFYRLDKVSDKEIDDLAYITPDGKIQVYLPKTNYKVVDKLEDLAKNNEVAAKKDDKLFWQLNDNDLDDKAQLNNEQSRKLFQSTFTNLLSDQHMKDIIAVRVPEHMKEVEILERYIKMTQEEYDTAFRLKELRAYTDVRDAAKTVLEDYKKYKNWSAHKDLTDDFVKIFPIEKAIAKELKENKEHEFGTGFSTSKSDFNKKIVATDLNNFITLFDKVSVAFDENDKALAKTLMSKVNEYRDKFRFAYNNDSGFSKDEIAEYRNTIYALICLGNVNLHPGKLDMQDIVDYNEYIDEFWKDIHNLSSTTTDNYKSIDALTFPSLDGDMDKEVGAYDSKISELKYISKSKQVSVNRLKETTANLKIVYDASVHEKEIDAINKITSKDVATDKEVFDLFAGYKEKHVPNKVYHAKSWDMEKKYRDDSHRVYQILKKVDSEHTDPAERDFGYRSERIIREYHNSYKPMFSAGLVRFRGIDSKYYQKVARLLMASNEIIDEIVRDSQSSNAEYALGAVCANCRSIIKYNIKELARIDLDKKLSAKDKEEAKYYIGYLNTVCHMYMAGENPISKEPGPGLPHDSVKDGTIDKFNSLRKTSSGVVKNDKNDFIPDVFGGLDVDKIMDEELAISEASRRQAEEKLQKIDKEDPEFANIRETVSEKPMVAMSHNAQFIISVWSKQKDFAKNNVKLGRALETLNEISKRSKPVDMEYKIFFRPETFVELHEELKMFDDVANICKGFINDIKAKVEKGQELNLEDKEVLANSSMTLGICNMAHAGINGTTNESKEYRVAITLETVKTIEAIGSGVGDDNKRFEFLSSAKPEERFKTVDAKLSELKKLGIIPPADAVDRRSALTKINNNIVKIYNEKIANPKQVKKEEKKEEKKVAKKEEKKEDKKVEVKKEDKKVDKKPEPKPVKKEDKKPEVKKEEPKHVKKPEVKAAPKPEVKAAPKPEVKVAPKPEVKVAPKPAPQPVKPKVEEKKPEPPKVVDKKPDVTKQDIKAEVPKQDIKVEAPKKNPEVPKPEEKKAEPPKDKVEDKPVFRNEGMSEKDVYPNNLIKTDDSVNNIKMDDEPENNIKMDESFDKGMDQAAPDKWDDLKLDQSKMKFIKKYLRDYAKELQATNSRFSSDSDQYKALNRKIEAFMSLDDADMKDADYISFLSTFDNLGREYLVAHRPNEENHKTWKNISLSTRQKDRLTVIGKFQILAKEIGVSNVNSDEAPGKCDLSTIGSRDFAVKRIAYTLTNSMIRQFLDQNYDYETVKDPNGGKSHKKYGKYSQFMLEENTREKTVSNTMKEKDFKDALKKWAAEEAPKVMDAANKKRVALGKNPYSLDEIKPFVLEQMASFEQGYSIGKYKKIRDKAIRDEKNKNNAKRKEGGAKAK